MRTETVVFFYLQEKGAARRYPWRKAEFSVYETEWCQRRLIAAAIPEYDFPGRHWGREKLKKKIRSSLVPRLGINSLETTVFLCHKSLGRKEKLLEREKESYREVLEELFPLELLQTEEQCETGRMTPEDVTETLLKEHCKFDALVILDDEQESRRMDFDGERFIREHCEGINFLAVVTRDSEKYTEVFEEVGEEYGLMGITVPELKMLNVPPKFHVLVVDAGLEDQKTWRYLPSGCIYLDLLSVEKRQRLMEARRKDIRYLSFSRQIEKKLKLQFLAVHP